MYILMNGVGVGFSVERQHINQLPVVSEDFNYSTTKIVVADSKEGWAKALKELIAMLYSGEIPQIDTKLVRPAGARLKTFGGRASGPEPLEDLFKFVTTMFQKAKGRKLNSIECHDIMCKIGEVVVVGGVRRSAMISLSNLSDDRMRSAKSGQWWEQNAHRALANNSIAYTERPDVGVFMHEWTSLYESKSGERGIFNREAAVKKMEAKGVRDSDYEWGLNPCGEILLRPNEFCNLSEVVCRADDSLESLINKVRVATILGTFQSCLTNFKYIRSTWKKNTEEERLLGVSLTGIFDCHILMNGNGTAIRKALNAEATSVNEVFASFLGIQASKAITCVKPSGTVSQLVDAASGIHPRYDKFYIRRVRGDVKDPITQFMKDMGIPNEPDFNKPENTVVFSFPIKAPDKATTRNDLSPIEHLEVWKKFQEEWCDHNPSATIQVKDEEWPEVGAWVWKNFDTIGGISFLPYDSGSYRQAPYETIAESQYDALLAQMPDAIDWDLLSDYEREDNTVSSQTLACASGACEVVDLV
jgi:ribonucleoside-diphosphate reductase alpha chain